MGQKKLIRFEQIRQFPNVLEYPQDMKGQWHTFFHNNHPIVLELACGKGEYALGLGSMYPDRNFIGVDIKGNRIWRGAKNALDNGLTNVAFLRTQIDKITDYFAPGEVSEIWITFPDPQLRMSKAKKRLTHPKFLRMYQQFLKKDGKVNLKTDSPALYEFTRMVINLYQLPLETDYDNAYAVDDRSSELNIRTHYEQLDIAQSNRVHYLRFSLNTVLDEATDDILKTRIREQETTG